MALSDIARCSGLEQPVATTATMDSDTVAREFILHPKVVFQQRSEVAPLDGFVVHRGGFCAPAPKKFEGMPC